MNTIDLKADTVCDVVKQQAAALKNPPRTPREVLETLEKCGLTQSVARLREKLGVA